MNPFRQFGSICLLLGATSSVACAQRTSGNSETTRLMSRLSALSADSMEGRRAGTPGAARARAWIIRELTAMGAKPVGSTFEHFVKLPARPGSDTAGANVVARIPGTRPGGPVIVLSAHYDHLGVRNGETYNGADDDASGCVALITIGERLMKAPLEHDVILAFFDAEESGMFGSRAFVGNGPFPPEQIVLNINLDMIARQDGKALWVAGTAHYPSLKPIADAAVEGSPISVRFGHDTKALKPGDDWTGSSDHAAFHAKGIPFMYLGVEDHPDYHKPGDDADKIDASFFRATVDYAFRLVRAADSRAGTIVRPAK